MKAIAHISNGIQFSMLNQQTSHRGVVPFHLYDLPLADLSVYAGVIISNFVDEPFLYEHRHILERYLQGGGVVCSFAELYLPWLPGNVIWQRSPLDLKDREIIVAEPAHPLFEGVNPYDLNYKEGVRGFFSRGFLDMPAHSTPLITDQEGKVILYIDRETTEGTILAGAGADLFTYGVPTSSSGRLTVQLLSWIQEEAACIERRVRN
jgi:hypothetical protein